MHIILLIPEALEFHVVGSLRDESAEAKYEPVENRASSCSSYMQEAGNFNLPSQISGSN